jgi:hypothetical protein
MCDFKDLERRGACRFSMGKSEANRPLRRPTRRWYDNIKMDLTEIVWEGVHKIDLAEGLL